MRSDIRVETDTKLCFSAEVQGGEKLNVTYFPNDDMFFLHGEDGESLTISMAMLEEIRQGMGEIMGKMFGEN